MNKISPLNSLLLVAALLASGPAYGMPPIHHHKPKPPTEDTPPPVDNRRDEWLKKAIAEYPTDACVVSREKLGGEMGEPVNYVFKSPKHPDRLIRLCCKNCIPTVKKDPFKYLDLINEAAAKAKARTT